jgi:hypothetical protein
MRDLTPLFPMASYTEEALDWEIFNAMYHMHIPPSESMAWPSRKRRGFWNMFKKQQKVNQEAAEKGK